MNQTNCSQILEQLKRTALQLEATLQKKNTDYSGTRSEFSNFELSAEIAGITPEQGIIVRMADKLSRLGNLVQPLHTINVKEESIDDTINDLIGYAIILQAYRRYLVNLASEPTSNHRTNIIGTPITNEEIKAYQENLRYEGPLNNVLTKKEIDHRYKGLK